MIPDWWEMTLLVFGTYRLWRLVGADKVTEVWRDRLFIWWGKRNRAWAEWADELVTCPWCLGSWMAIAVWGVWLVLPYATLVACGMLTAMTGVGLLGKIGGD